MDDDLAALADAMSGLSFIQATEVAASAGRSVPEIYDHALACHLGSFGAICNADFFPGSAQEIEMLAARALGDASTVGGVGPAICESIAALSEASFRLAAAVQWAEFGDIGAPSTPATYLLSRCAGPLALHLRTFAMRCEEEGNSVGLQAALDALTRLHQSSASDCQTEIERLAGM